MQLAGGQAGLELGQAGLELGLGLAWSLGCLLFGLLVSTQYSPPHLTWALQVVRRGAECSIGRQYLAQAALAICGAAILALPQVCCNTLQVVRLSAGRQPGGRAPLRLGLRSRSRRLPLLHQGYWQPL